MDGTILSVDPSSTRTGWALLSQGERLLQGGILTPDKVRSDPQFRIAAMCRDLRQLLDEIEPETILIEITSGKVAGHKRNAMKGAGLGVYGMAVGAIWQAAEAWLRSRPPEQKNETEIVLIKENDWTRGIPKSDRIAGVASRFPEYSSEQDPGGDLADAIGLAIWYLTEHRARLVRQVL